MTNRFYAAVHIMAHLAPHCQDTHDARWVIARLSAAHADALCTACNENPIANIDIDVTDPNLYGPIDGVE